MVDYLMENIGETEHERLKQKRNNVYEIIIYLM